jgi:hypothetical protein
MKLWNPMSEKLGIKPWPKKWHPNAKQDIDSCWFAFKMLCNWMQMDLQVVLQHWLEYQPL